MCKRTVFISYSSRDREFAEKLAADLRESGAGVWFDQWEIKVGDSIIQKINDGIHDNDYLAVVLSPDSVASPWVRKELNAAMMRELDRRSVVVLPILYRDCEIPTLIAEKHYADFRKSYKSGFSEILVVLAPDAEGERRQEKLAALYGQAVKFLEAKKWQKALDKWDEVRAIDPNYLDSQKVEATALYGQAMEFLEAKKWQKALDRWAKVQAIDPDYLDSQKVEATALYGQAMEFLEAKKWQKALDRWAKVRAIDPSYSDSQKVEATALYGQAVEFLEAKEWRKALDKWAKVRAIEPEYPDRKKVVAKAKIRLVLQKVPLWRWGAIALLVSVLIGGAIFLAIQESGSPVTPAPAMQATTQTATVTATAMPVPPTDMATATYTPSPTATPNSTATDTPSPTATPTSTATDTPGSPTSPPVPTTAVPQPAGGPIALTIYLRRTGTDFAELSDAQVNEGLYKEGQTVYGDAAVQIGDTVYHFDKPEVGPGEPEQLPDPWRVEFGFAPDLVARTGNQAGFDSKKARFWVGTLDGSSAIGKDSPYSLTMRLYEGDEWRGSIQVFFAVADAPDGGDGSPSVPGGKSTPP